MLFLLKGWRHMISRFSDVEGFKQTRLDFSKQDTQYIFSGGCDGAVKMYSLQAQKEQKVGQVWTTHVRCHVARHGVDLLFWFLFCESFDCLLHHAAWRPDSPHVLGRRDQDGHYWYALLNGVSMWHRMLESHCVHEHKIHFYSSFFLSSW